MTTYLVTQASGKQSQWTITHLLEAGASVHAVVRNPRKLPPVLERSGVTVFKGESDDPDAIFQAAQGCTGVFLNTYAIPGLETRQAQSVVDACKKAGVETIVLSTVLHAGNKSMWDDKVTEECGLREYYASKSAVEDIVRGAGFTAYTILRPAFIHINYLLPSVHVNYPALPNSGELDHVFNGGTKLLHTDANDVGKYAGAALRDPAKFGGKEIELGYENITIDETRDILAKVSGRDVQTRRRTPEEMETLVPGQRFQLWANSKDMSPVADAARSVQAKFGIRFTSLEEALRRDRDQLLECLPA